MSGWVAVFICICVIYGCAFIYRLSCTLIINGETKEFSDDSTLQNIITNLQIENKVMAAAVNMNIVKKDDWNKFIPKNDDKIELLQFVGGG